METKESDSLSVFLSWVRMMGLALGEARRCDAYMIDIISHIYFYIYYYYHLSIHINECDGKEEETGGGWWGHWGIGIQIWDDSTEVVFNRRFGGKGDIVLLLLLLVYVLGKGKKGSFLGWGEILEGFESFFYLPITIVEGGMSVRLTVSLCVCMCALWKFLLYVMLP